MYRGADGTRAAFGGWGSRGSPVPNLTYKLVYEIIILMLQMVWGRLERQV